MLRAIADNTNNKGGGDDGEEDKDAGGKVSSPKGGKKTVEMIQNEIAMLEKQAYEIEALERVAIFRASWIAKRRRA